MEENKDQDKPVEKNETGSEIKPMGGIAIVGYNILALAFYTIIFKLASKEGGIIFDAFILFFHVIFCFGMAIGRKSWMWVLSAVLVLAIGFSTCVMIGPGLN
jgi:hypothetical protein